MIESEWKNKLYYGDNLVWLQNHDHFRNESVDLIYLDPPFNSNANYNIIFSEPTGEESVAQTLAFDDTWGWDRAASQDALVELESGHSDPEIADFIKWVAGQGDETSKSMAAYLAMMAVRLLELHRVLKSTGSIFLHCDQTASHYLKVLMDKIFSATNFRNEIIWKRTSAHSDSKRFGQVTDSILFYSKSGKRVWNPPTIEHDPQYKANFYRFEDERGRYRLHEIIRTASMGARPNLVYEYKGYTPEWGWRMERNKLETLDAEGRLVRSKSGRPYRKTYLPSGQAPTNLWLDIGNVAAQSKERLGFPTQKPLALLKRIIEASSDIDDIVLDPFCGCGTTIIAAHNPESQRKWIGIDVTYLAIDLVEKRLVASYGENVKQSYRVYGKPSDAASAQALANKSKKEFELWALSLVGAVPRARDAGADGLLTIAEKGNKSRRIIVQVKGGEMLAPGIVRELIGTVDKEKAAMGLLITLYPPTSGMLETAIHTEPYESPLWSRKYPRIQIRTIKELIEDHKDFDLPPRVSLTRKAQPVNEQGQSVSML